MSAETRGQLRYRRTWFALGVALLAAVVGGSLASLPAPAEGVMLHDKWLHLGAYGALMLWFAQVFRSPLARLMLGVALAALGVGVEYLQGMTATRQFDELDMLANSAGVLLGGGLSFTPAGRTLAALEGLFERASSRTDTVRDG